MISVPEIKLKRSAIATLTCEPGVAYEILSDYGRYGDWFPGMKAAKVLAEESNFAIAEFEFSALPGRKVNVECIHAPTQIVLARTLTGTKPAIRIEWSIVPIGSGQTRIQLKMEGPLSLGFLTRFKNFFNPQKAIDTFTGMLAAYGDGPAGEKIFELIEAEGQLICLYRGTKYQLKAMS